MEASIYQNTFDCSILSWKNLLHPMKLVFLKTPFGKDCSKWFCFKLTNTYIGHVMSQALF